MDPLDNYFISGAVAYSQNNIYLFGGASNINLMFRPSVPSNIVSNYSLPLCYN